MEEWRDVVGYEGLYQVSNLGKVRNKKNFRILKSYLTNCYPSVGLYINNKKRYTCYIHRLIAQSFIHNPNNFYEINHKDLNKLNNDLSNLEWVNHKENMHHAINNGHGGHKYKKGFKMIYFKSKLTKEEVREIRLLLDKREMLQKDIAKIYNISNPNVCSIKYKKTWINV